MVAGAVQGGPGVAGAGGQLCVSQVRPQADELRSHRAALEIERAALPQPEQARFQSPKGEESGGPRPQAGRRRIRAADQAPGQVEELARARFFSLHQFNPWSQAASLLARRTRSTAAEA